MVLKSIIIQNFGGVTLLSYEFRERLNVVKEIGRDVISYAIRAIFNHKTPPPPASWVGVDTRVEARVSLPQKSYHVTLTPDTEGGRLRLRSYDKDGIDVTQEYLYLTSHCIEQDMSDVFDGEEGIYHLDRTDDILQNREMAYLRQFPNVVLTPHMAFYTQMSMDAMIQNSVEGLLEFQKTGTSRLEIKL